MRINVFLLILAAFAVYFLFLIREDIIQHKDLAKEKEVFVSKFERTNKENQLLTACLVKAKNSKSVESLARERLNFIRKGEIAYKVCR